MLLRRFVQPHLHHPREWSHLHALTENYLRTVVKHPVQFSSTKSYFGLWKRALRASRRENAPWSNGFSNHLVRAKVRTNFSGNPVYQGLLETAP